MGIKPLNSKKKKVVQESTQNLCPTSQIPANFQT